MSASIDVLLLTDVPGQGRRHQIIRVSEAYARNFLLPKKLARVATETVRAQAARQHEKQVALTAARAAEMAAAKKRLTNVTVRITAKGHSTGKLFAAVRTETITGELARQYPVEIDGIKLEPDHLKNFGSHPVTLVWPDGERTSITVVIDHA